MRKLIAVGALVLIGTLVAALLYLKDRRFKVIITEQQIASVLKRKFPAEKNYLSVFTITYSNPTVTLLETADRVQVGLDATLNIRINDEPKELGGTALVTTGVRYDSETQQFFLDDAVFDHLEIQGVPQRWLDPVAMISATAAKEWIETKPIYRIKARDAKTTAAKWLLKGFDVRNQAIHVTLGM